MKLRIKDNSVRFRLLRGEVEALADTGYIEARTSLSATDADGSFRYSIEHTAEYPAIAAEQKGFAIHITAPTSEIVRWAHGDAVGLYARQEVLGGEVLSIVIEKDFACIDRSDAENEDTFDNPNAAC